MTAPDVVGVLAGFRSWRVSRGELLSPFIPCRWDGRVLHAECYDANRSLVRGEGWLDAPHASPHPACQCGVYAWNRPDLRTYYGEGWWCEGVITGWGRVEVHADGWRAEHARVEALAHPAHDDPRLAAMVRAIAERLAVPLVDRGALPGLAGAAGILAGDPQRPRGAAGRRDGDRPRSRRH